MKDKKSLGVVLFGTLAVFATSHLIGEELEEIVEFERVTIIGQDIARDAEIDTYSAEDLEEFQIQDIEDLVRSVPGVSVSRGDDRWGSSGFNIRGLDEDRVAINVDGIPQGETLKYEGGQAYGYFKGSRNGVDIEALKSVEIVKGADSILSGSGALAGAVNYTTKDPSDFLELSGGDTYFGLKASFNGANDELMGSLSFANRVGGLETLVIYTHREGSEYKNYDMDGADIAGEDREIPDPQDTETDSLLVKLDYSVDENQTLGVVFSLYGLNPVTDAQSFNGGWYSNRIGDDYRETNRIGLTYDLQLEGGVFDSMEASYNRQTSDFEANTLQHVEYYFGEFFNANEDRRDVRSLNQELDQLAVDFTKEFGTDRIFHKLVYGVEYLDKGIENSQVRYSNEAPDYAGYVRNVNSALIPSSESRTHTIYGLDTVDFGENTRLRIGARLDDVNYDSTADENYEDDTGTLGETSFSSFTWTVGLEQDLTENLTAAIGISTGFRAPTIEEMYQVDGDFDDWDTIANPNLEGEKSRNFDISIKGEYELGSFRLAYFNSNYEDFIAYEEIDSGSPFYVENPNYVQDPNDENSPANDEYYIPINIDGAEIEGVEFSGDLDLSKVFGISKGYRASLHAAYTYGDEDNGDPVFTIQPFSMSFGLSYLQPENVWGASLMTTYTEAKNKDDAYRTGFDDDENVVRIYPSIFTDEYAAEADKLGSTLLDLTFFYNVTDDLKLTAGVYNLTDEEYYTWDGIRFLDQGDFRPGIGASPTGILRYTDPGRYVKFSASYSF
ncbi:TonB-dependent hemoglobin/transferrin/lactoferrin family receptor [Puniceicoccaceae bacterium K14]|nr:TonB-dependent hemoglobin/transferrin/lactoferrin family receptor [Puniceicoccaceae bacterium K14]